MKFFFSVIALIVCAFVNAQSLDLQLRELNYSGDSFPSNITKCGNKIAFTTNASPGKYLWFYDAAENSIVKVSNSNFINILVEVDGTLFFTKTFSTTELWKSDGTIEGTVLVKTLTDSSFPSNGGISNKVVYNGKLYFTKSENIHGELWVSDGSETGTHLLKVLSDGIPYNGTPPLFVFNNFLYFSANTSESGFELWKSDGTSEGTALFTEIAPGTISSYPEAPIIFNNNFYFLATTPTNGRELWKSDGTSTGTSLFKEFVTGSSGIYSENNKLNGIAISDEYFIFSINYNNAYRLWKSNGTFEGTEQLKLINSQNDGFQKFINFTTLNDTPYFLASEGFDTGSEIWKTDGTAAGTMAVINTETTAGEITHFFSGNNYLIFRGSKFNPNTSNYDTRPWVSDGTQVGTQLLKDIELFSSSANNFNFALANEKIYFFGGYNSLNGSELWSTDGTEQGTQMTIDIYHDDYGVSAENGMFSAVSLNDNLIFIGNDGLTGSEPFISDGTETGTHLLKNINPETEMGSIYFSDSFKNNMYTKAGNKIFFKAYNGNTGNEIYTSDGTSEGTHIVKDINPGSASSITENVYFMACNNIFYFKASDNIHGNELWRTDGTEEGTWLVKDIYPGRQSGLTTISNNSFAYLSKNFAVFNGFLYFIALDETGYAVWKTDGTEAGTEKVIVLLSNTGENTGGVTILGASQSKIFFASVYDSSNGRDTIWGSDGTQDGTYVIHTYYTQSSINFRTVFFKDDIMYYQCENSPTGLGLYRTDGTTEGTYLIKGNLGFGIPYFISFIKASGNQIYFGVGREYGTDKVDYLYRTDGTVNGTVLLASNNLGLYNNFTVYGNKLLFSEINTPLLYYVDQDSVEPQTIDLTIGGAPVENLTDISSIFGVVNDKIYMGISTIASGHELYVANSNGLLGTEQQDPSTTAKTKENDIVLYPNPAKEWVNITSNTESMIYSLEIYDISGKKLNEAAINDISYKLKINSLNPGVYFIKVKSSRGISTQKLIKS